MANKQGEGLPLSEIYAEVSKELRVPLGNMSRWWRNKEKASRHLSDVDASQCIAVLSPSQSCCHGLLFASLMLHSALLFGHPPHLAGFAERFVLVLEQFCREKSFGTIYTESGSQEVDLLTFSSFRRPTLF